ncbi:MAG: hypothetical protein ACYC9L_08500 [Sulfuricaulis sp.]
MGNLRPPGLLRLQGPITNRGEAVADLVPSRHAGSKDKTAVVEQIKAFMRTNPVPGVDIKDLVSQGRA